MGFSQGSPTLTSPNSSLLRVTPQQSKGVPSGMSHGIPGASPVGVAQSDGVEELTWRSRAFLQVRQHFLFRLVLIYKYRTRSCVYTWVHVYMIVQCMYHQRLFRWVARDILAFCTSASTVFKFIFFLMAASCNKILFLYRRKLEVYHLTTVHTFS